MTKEVKQREDDPKARTIALFQAYADFCKCLLDAYAVVDRSGCIAKTNSLFAAMVKIGARKLQKMQLHEVLQLFLDNKELRLADLLELKTANRFDEIRGSLPDGSDLNLILGVYPLVDKEAGDDTSGLFLLIRDVTAEAELQGKYRKKAIQSITCPLTGLFTRAYFESYLEQTTSGLDALPIDSEHRDLSIIMIDIDHFKPVNDTYGHQAGDHIIKEIAEVMRRAFRKTDILCRYGGEEYLAILPSTDLFGATVAAEHFRSAVEATVFSFADTVIPISVSCGVSQVLPKEQNHAMGSIARADEALYHSKENGRNCVSYHDGRTLLNGVKQ